MVEKVKIKGGRKVPKTYVPKSLSPSDRKKQVESIRKGTDRPKLKSFKGKRSTYTEEFEKKYGKKNKNREWIHKNLLRKEGQDQIIKKGMGAYYSSGSRPNQTPYSWGMARLYSVIMGGSARRVDKKIWDKYKV